MTEKTAYITSIGAFLPGPSISNDLMESYLGAIHGKPSRLRRRILKSNGIVSRHYALNQAQETTFQNSELAANAVYKCLERAVFDKQDVDLLATATTQGDLPLPGLASLVQAALQLPPCEILSTHGVCSSSLMALKSASNNVRLGQSKYAVVCASELASRLLKSSRYENVDKATDFEAEFLRWMLSDGASALTVQPNPKDSGFSLKIDWIEIKSYASDFDLCMSCGTNDQAAWTVGEKDQSDDALPAKSFPRAKSWQDYPTYALAEQHGALLIRQNLRVLEAIVRVGLEGLLSLMQAGKLKTDEIDHFVCHYSSHYFKEEILKLSKLLGCEIPEGKWFSNLYTKGNTGCAALFIALEELLYSGKLKTGQTILCVVPESGRFCTAFMRLTVVNGRE
jgi:3-oxoacyl-[acyl-carrier-protein] synthase-3